MSCLDFCFGGHWDPAKGSVEKLDNLDDLALQVERSAGFHPMTPMLRWFGVVRD